MRRASEQAHVVIVVLSGESEATELEGVGTALQEVKGFVVYVGGRQPEISDALVDLVVLDEDVARERLLDAAERFLGRRDEIRRDTGAAPPLFPARAEALEMSPKTFRRRLIEAARKGVFPALPSLDVAETLWTIEPFPIQPFGYERAPAEGAPPTALKILPALVGAVAGALAVLAAAKWLLGWFVQPDEESESGETIVGCTVFAPSTAVAGASILVQAFVHRPEEASEAMAVASAMQFDVDADRRAFQSLWSPIKPDSRLDFELRMPELEIDDPVASLVWRGWTESVQFGVRIPPETPPGTVAGTLSILHESVPIGHVKFKLAIEHDVPSAPSEPQGDEARRYTFAFVSYATHDRPEVLPRVQMLRINGIGYFQDVLSLQPGDRWAKRIEAGIDRCDLFLLFWSKHAKSSEWVRKEVEHALGRKGGDELEPPEIYPVPIELPPVPPWPELAHLHFNDPLLYFVAPREGG